ncbi:hypothetical protein QO002_001435 [Pararhizobium capsulatum DSM 1112]|uniref:Uncharacterized protein n=1 Tax=Pararhizobium capsulatum DSM 1112 TaxID=1121113 RepID=A0ABU0BQY8_9HYPH|nr:hypothetical protein [Pararhizobium capsulatum]MDQ0319297.1 hypothetical protein [Pararhizobium capsulatum DSM 1112]
MFRIPQPGFGTIQPEESWAHEQWLSDLMTADHVIEGWHCDLKTGMFSVGEITRSRHALDDSNCGLLDILRVYDPESRKIALAILEEATASASCFCFCTLVELDGGSTHPVWCVGTSTLGNETTGDRMQGVFAYKRADL